MRTVKIEGEWIARTPVHTGGNEKTGSEATVRRTKWLCGEEVIDLAHVAGSSPRGIIRRLAMRWLCEEVGYEVFPEIYHVLFAGGVLKAVGVKGQVDVGFFQSVRESVPPVSLFGMSYNNQSFGGRLKVAHATPACREMNEYHPEHLHSPLSIYELIGESFATRRDDLHLKRTDGEQAVQMMFGFETFIPGTHFRHALTVEDCSPVEEGCLRHTVGLWEQRPYVGGKSATGYGEIAFRYDWPEDFGLAEDYVHYVEESKESIRSVLTLLGEGLVAAGTGSRRKRA